MPDDADVRHTAVDEIKKYPASDFMDLLENGPKISLKQKKISKERIHLKENDDFEGKCGCETHGGR